MKLLDRIKQGTSAEQTVIIRDDEVVVRPLSDKAFARATRKCGVKMSFEDLKRGSKDLLATADLLDFSLAVCREGMVIEIPQGIDPSQRAAYIDNLIENSLRGGLSAEIAAKILEVTFGGSDNIEDFSIAQKGSS